MIMSVYDPCYHDDERPGDKCEAEECEFYDEEECRCTKYDPDPIELTPWERKCLDKGFNPWYKTGGFDMNNRVFCVSMYLSCIRYICTTFLKHAATHEYPTYAVLAEHVLKLCNMADPEEFKITPEWIAYQYTLQNIAIDYLESDSIIKTLQNSTFFFTKLNEEDY